MIRKRRRTTRRRSPQRMVSVAERAVLPENLETGYDQDHVTFDEFDMPYELHCLRCHCVIVRRHERPSHRDPKIMLHALVRAPNYREVEVELSDGSLMYMPFCTDCAKNPIDPDKALEVVKGGWIKSLTHLGRPEHTIEREKERRADLKVTKVGGILDARKLQ